MAGAQCELEEWVDVNNGIQAAIVNDVWHRGIERTIEGSGDLRCKVQLEGHAHYSTGADDWTLKSDSKFTFIYKPVGCLKKEYIEPGTSERSITLIFPVLEESLAGYSRDDAAVDRALRSISSELVMRRFPLSYSTGGVVGSVLNLDRSARSFDRLRQSRIDEIATMVLDVFLESYSDERNIGLSARERRQINEARDLLVADLANPPSLQELAASVGTNRTKLNQGFNSLFGAPVFRFLQRERMASAKTSIETSASSISDIAEICGYEHVSNFSNAFKAYHGVTPSSLRN